MKTTDKKSKKVKKLKIKKSGALKNKSFFMAETSDGRFVVRDPSYPTSGEGVYAEGEV